MNEPMKNSRKFSAALRKLADELERLPEQLVFDSGRLYAGFGYKLIGITLIQRGYAQDGWPTEPVQKISLEVPIPD